MTLLLSLSDTMAIGGMKDLNDLVPEGFQGEAVNYGQGEGQIRIGDTEWGFYAGPTGYSIVFEEGALEFDQAVAMAAGILAQIRKNGELTSPVELRAR